MNKPKTKNILVEKNWPSIVIKYHIQVLTSSSHSYEAFPVLLIFVQCLSTKCVVTAYIFISQWNIMLKHIWFDLQIIWIAL